MQTTVIRNHSGDQNETTFGEYDSMRDARIAVREQMRSEQGNYHPAQLLHNDRNTVYTVQHEAFTIEYRLVNARNS